jgi:mRNA interferase RelE/StbE
VGSIKLTNEDAYRIRVGDYRVIYNIHDDQLVVLVIDVGHRRDVYRRR